MWKVHRDVGAAVSGAELAGSALPPGATGRVWTPVGVALRRIESMSRAVADAGPARS